MVEVEVDDRPVYTLKSAPAVPASYDEAIERARALKPKLLERVAETERLRRLPAENVADLLENGLYGLMTPRRFGGSELGSEAMIDVTIELASACPSTGWVHMLWTAHMWLLALFPPAAQEELWRNPNTLASSVVNTVGDVVPVDGGYRWSGRGFFSSGVDHCNWLTRRRADKAQTRPKGAARRTLDAHPALRTFEIVDDWYTVGLKGTGSKTIVIQDAFMPEERTLANTASGGRRGARATDQPRPDVRRHLVGELHRGDGGARHWRRARIPAALRGARCGRNRATSTMACW